MNVRFNFEVPFIYHWQSDNNVYFLNATGPLVIQVHMLRMKKIANLAVTAPAAEHEESHGLFFFSIESVSTLVF